MIDKIYNSKELKNFLYIFSGAFLLSLAVVTFLVPNQIAPGGTPGLAVIINHLFDLQLGLVMLMINIPLILLSMKFIDKQYGIRVIITICSTSFTVDFIREFIGFHGLVINPILASVFGGILIGISLGLIIRGNSAAGGPAAISRIIASRTKFKEQHILIGLDAIIVILAGITFKNIETTLLSLTTVYVSARGIDLVLSGGATYKIVHIATKNYDRLAKEISLKLNIRGSILDGYELDFKDEKKILLITIENNRILELKRIIQEFDDDSFMVISDASELMGRGH